MNVRKKGVANPEEIYSALTKAVREVTGETPTHKLSIQEYIDEIRGFLENVIRQLPCYVYWKNKNFQYVFCNDITAKIMGLNSAKEATGKTDYDFGWDKELVDSYRRTDTKIIETGQPVLNLQEDLVDKNGRVFHTLVNKMPLRNQLGEIIGVLGITVDITNEKQSEIAKDNFMSNMEHDLRTPFAGIGGAADLLYSVYSAKYPELKDLLEIMTKSCTQWQEVHNRIFDALDVQQTLKIECFYIQDEMEKMKDLMSATSKMKQIKFNLFYPSREKTGPIETDLLKFKLILSSLVGNAINFTKVGSVTLKLEYNRTDFILNIIDTGIGIAQDKLESIFEKFTKLSRSNTYGEKFQGMGLGLYNARKDAEKIQASITVKSELGKGSTFTLRLPTKIKCT